MENGKWKMENEEVGFEDSQSSTPYSIEEVNVLLEDSPEYYYQSQDPLQSQSYRLSVRTTFLVKYLQKEHHEYVLSKQVLRSGTAICALLQEGEQAQSKPDFINKLSIALKEANETRYWVCLLHDTHYLNRRMIDSLMPDIVGVIKMLAASIITAKASLEKSRKK